ncbi:MAG: hypothetical protein V8R40_14410 [Dysosmobacter sp.]
MQALERQYHINCVPGMWAVTAFCRGIRAGAPAIAALFDDAKQVAYNREFNVWTGRCWARR